MKKNPEYFMVSLEVEFFFTNKQYDWRKLLKSAVIQIIDSLYKNNKMFSNIHKNQSEKLLRAALCNNCFSIDGIINEHVDGVAMTSPLGSSLAIAFLAYYEKIRFNDCLDEFRHKSYLDDTFVLFRSLHHREKFNEYLNKKHSNIKSTNGKEVSGSLPILEVHISQNNKGFTTTVNQKSTFS